MRPSSLSPSRCPSFSVTTTRMYLTYPTVCGGVRISFPSTAHFLPRKWIPAFSGASGSSLRRSRGPRHRQHQGHWRVRLYQGVQGTRPNAPLQGHGLRPSRQEATENLARSAPAPKQVGSPEKGSISHSRRWTAYPDREIRKARDRRSRTGPIKRHGAELKSVAAPSTHWLVGVSAPNASLDDLRPGRVRPLRE